MNGFFRASVRWPAIVVFALSIAAAAPPRIERIDPPSWWADHSINPVRLLVGGRNLQGAHVTSSDPRLVPSDVKINSAGTYVFVSLTIAPSTASGIYALGIETAAGKASVPFRIEAPLDPQRNFQGVTDDDVIYLLMPDRFANGDPSNDSPSGAPAASTDRKNPHAYHGGDFRGIIEHLSYFKELGVTALWLTPWVQNWNGAEPNTPPSTYYHGYHAIDCYAVEERFGDLSTLRELVEQAHALGIKIIQDQVANHVGSHHPWVDDPPLDDWFHPRRPIKRPIRTDVLSSPHSAPEDVGAIVDAWFTQRLPDLNQEEPEVVRYEIQNALWWVGVTGIDGIRQDTLQYMRRPFIRDLCAALHRQFPQLRMIGEVTTRDPAHAAFYIGGHRGWDGLDTQLDSVFDFPLQEVACDVFTGKKPASALRDLLKSDGLYPEASRLTTLTGNHDRPRFLALDGATLDGAKLLVAFTLAVRGTPQLYYGDEVALGGGKEDDGNRRDFPGGFSSDPSNAFTAIGRGADGERMFAWTRDWLRLRREHVALRHGEHVDLAWNDEVYVFLRRAGGDTVVVALNRGTTAKEISASAAGLGLPTAAALDLLLGTDGVGRVGNGAVTLKIPPTAIVAFGVVPE